jgi:hypothetical protein
MTQNFTVFATFTVPVRKENFYHSIASTFFINEEHTLPDLGNIVDRFGHSMFKHYTLIVVEGINPDPTVNREQEPFPNLKTISVTPEEFFNPTRTIQYFSRDLESQSNLIVMFRNTNWSSTLLQFRTIGMVISGGSTVKRHMLSPVQVRLIEFLKCWFGFDIMRRIVESYYSETKELRTGVKPLLDFTSEAVSSAIREQIGDKNDWLSNPPFDNINITTKNINENMYNTWLLYSFETSVVYRSFQPALHLLVGKALASFNKDVVLKASDDFSISIQITLATEDKDNILLTNVENFTRKEFAQSLKHCNEILKLETKQTMVEYKEIKQVIIRYKISTVCEDNNSNNNSNNKSNSISNPFGINGQTRKFHTSYDIIDWKEFIFSIELVEKFVEDPIQLAVEKFNESIALESQDKVVWIKNIQVRNKNGEYKLEKDHKPGDKITHIKVTYIILTETEYYGTLDRLNLRPVNKALDGKSDINCKFTNYSKNNSSNNDKREYHSISFLNSINIKLSDIIPASVYNTNINNFTPLSYIENRKFHTSAICNADGVSNDNSLITINADPNLKYFEYKLDDNTLNQFDLEKSVLSFYESELTVTSDDVPLLIQFRLRLTDGREEDISFILKLYVQETIRMMTLLNGFYALKDELLSQIKDPKNKFMASHIIFKYIEMNCEDISDNKLLSLDNNVNSDQFSQNKQISKYLERLNYTPFKPNRFNRDCWEYFSYLLKDHTITDYQIEQAIYEFYDTLLMEWKGETDAIIQFKLRLSNNKYMDLSFHLKFKNTEYNELKYLFVKFLSLKEYLIKDDKGNLRATHIVFKYMFNGSTYLNDPYDSNNIYNSKFGNPSSKTKEHKKEYHTLTSGNHLKNKLPVNLNLFSFTPLVKNHIRNFSSVAHKQTIYDKDSPVIKDLINIIITEPVNTGTQLKIERYLRNQHLESLIMKRDKDSNKNKPINYNVLTSSLQKELFENEEDLLKLINNYKTNVKHKNVKDKTDNQLIQEIVLNSPNEFIISIMFGRLLKIFSNNGRLNQNTYSTNVYIDLGRELIEKYIYVLYLRSLNVIDPAKYRLSLRYPLSQWKEDHSELMDILKDSTFQLRVGSLLVGWMKELSLLDNKVVTVSSKQKHNIVIIGKNLEKTLPKDISKVPLLRLPNRIPMIVPPKPYFRDKSTGVETLGGYLLNDVEYTDGIVLENWRLTKRSLVLEDNIIYDMVNYTSSVAFKINTKVLDFILVNHKKYSLIIDPDFIHPLSIKDKLIKSEKVLLESFYSKRDLEKNILGLAEIFRRVPKFYMPVRLDYRGRINVMTEYLKYQGTELAKALLLFAEGEKVNISDQLSINYLKIFGANSFGNKIEKLSFSDRVKWIDYNICDIVNFENGTLISKAENKLLFISFCFEYNNYLNALNNNLPYFVTHLPIVLDATCNGLNL